MRKFICMLLFSIFTVVTLSAKPIPRTECSPPDAYGQYEFTVATVAVDAVAVAIEAYQYKTPINISESRYQIRRTSNVSFNVPKLNQNIRFNAVPERKLNYYFYRPPLLLQPKPHLKTYRSTVFGLNAYNTKQNLHLQNLRWC